MKTIDASGLFKCDDSSPEAVAHNDAAWAKLLSESWDSEDVHIQMPSATVHLSALLSFPNTGVMNMSPKPAEQPTAGNVAWRLLLATVLAAVLTFGVYAAWVWQTQLYYLGSYAAPQHFDPGEEYAPTFAVRQQRKFNQQRSEALSNWPSLF